MKTLDDELRALLRDTWRFDDAPPTLLHLGQPALERLLDAPDSAFWATETEWRDYGGNRNQAIAAFAKADMDRVLVAMQARKWTDGAIALSGVGLVDDARVVPFLIRAYADAEPTTRARAIAHLGCQRDPQATETVLRALRDRSSEVQLTAIRALGESNDRKMVAHLQAMAKRHARSRLITQEIKQAIAGIRKQMKRS